MKKLTPGKLVVLFFVISMVVTWLMSGDMDLINNFRGIFFSKPDRFKAVISPYYYSVLILMGINIILSVSLALLNGFTGLFTMGHAGFMALGAYTSASVSVFLLPGAHPMVHLVAGIVIGGGLCALLGYFIGYTCLRLSGDYLGMVTMGFGEIIRIVILNVDAVGGARGMIDIPQYTNIGWVMLFALVTVLFVKRLRDGRHGRAMLAIKENEMAANLMGISPIAIKIKAFALSSFMAGMAGALFAHSEGYLSTQTFTFVKSFEVIAMNVIGGLGSISGAIMGGAILTLLPEVLRKLQDFTGVDLRMLIYAFTMVLIMILRPQGILGTKEWKWLSSK